jgi:hypothetical protein
MSLKKIIKKVEKMKNEGTLPVLPTETIETPFGRMTLLKHPAMDLIDWSEMNKIRDEMIDQRNEHRKKQDQLLQDALMKNAIPPIKGELTKGKVKWRGLKLIVKNMDHHTIERWIEQRGKIISPIIKEEFKISFD